MREVFADASYWIAIADPSDSLSEQAVLITEDFVEAHLVTTDEVLVEFLNYFSGYGRAVRNRAAAMVRAILDDPGVRVCRQSRDSFLDGLDLYERRRDKSYSLTDCISMRVMQEDGIQDVLTADRDFQREGFRVLLGT
jgi:predicted nucleic acid-binding protein